MINLFESKPNPVHDMMPHPVECKRPTSGGGKTHASENFTLTTAEARQLMEAAPEDRREFLYGPGGVFGPKGPFSTPIVRYIQGDTSGCDEPPVDFP